MGKVPNQEEANSNKPICGLVMPVSATDSCGEQHWLDVKGILFDAIKEAELEPHMVSDADDVGIIQKRIIQNLYSNPIVVCDVSAKNPNVMFELGLRLAFDKPTIIVKDDQTSYSFDTSPIEHLTYPRDLRFNQITKFKKDLTNKITGTLQKSETDSSYTTFLKHFGEFKIAKLDTTEVSKEDYILQELVELRRQLSRWQSRQYRIREHIPERETSRVGHRMSPDACQKKLAYAVARILEQQDAGRLFADPEAALDRCRDMELLPDCFEVANLSCIERFRAEIDQHTTGRDGELEIGAS